MSPQCSAVEPRKRPLCCTYICADHDFLHERTAIVAICWRTRDVRALLALPKKEISTAAAVYVCMYIYFARTSTYLLSRFLGVVHNISNPADKTPARLLSVTPSLFIGGGLFPHYCTLEYVQKYVCTWYVFYLLSLFGD